MSQPTLFGRLLRTQTLVMVSIGVLLVGLALPGMWYLVRRSQDRELKRIARTVDNGISQEMRDEGTSLVDAAREFVRETNFQDWSIEIQAADGTWIASRGQQTDLVPGARAPIPPLGCSSHSAVEQGGSAVRMRSCVVLGKGGAWIRAMAQDRTMHHEFLEIAGLLLLLVPLTVVVGVILTRRSIKNQLAPLEALRVATLGLESGAALEFTVKPDTLELRALENALNGLLARLSNALEAERSFAHEASHELRTPLTGLRLRLEQLATNHSDDKQLGRSILRCVADVESLSRLVEALLLLARTEVRERPTELVNLADLARDVAARQMELDSPTLPPLVVEAPDEALVDGSEDLLRRAIANLVENTRKHGGPRVRARVRVAELASTVELRVADDGPGMPIDVRAHAFERFYRGAGAVLRNAGAGLGLATVAATVRLHGGDVAIADSDLGGVEVILSLPRHRNSERIASE